MAQAHAPFDRSIIEAEGRALDAQERRTRGKAQDAGRIGIRRRGRQAVLGAHQQNAVGFLKEIIKRVGKLFDLGEIGKEFLWQPDGFAYKGNARARADPLDADDLGTGCKMQGPLLGAGRAANRRPRGSTVRNDQVSGRIEHVEEAKEHVRGGVLHDEGATALLTHHQTLSGQSADRLARGALADAKFRGDLKFTGNELARLPNARADALHELLPDLGVERAGVRGGGGAHMGNTCCHSTKSYISLMELAWSQNIAVNQATREKACRRPTFWFTAPRTTSA